MLIDWHNLRLIVSSYFALGHKHVLSLLAAVCSTGHIRRSTLKNLSGVVWSTYSVAPGLIFRFDDFFYKFCPLSTDRSAWNINWCKCFTGVNPNPLLLAILHVPAQISMHTKFVCVRSGEVLSTWLPFAMNEIVSESMAWVGRERLRWTLCWEIHAAGSSLPNNARTMVTV